MSFDVLCLRPEADFTRAGVTPPAGLTRQASATRFREAWANVERALVIGEAPLNRVY